MKKLAALVPIGFTLAMSSAAGPALGAPKPPCATYCNALCQQRVAKGLTQPAGVPLCVRACTDQNRGGMGGKNSTVAGGKCV